jgi:hypothetical protein
MSSLPPFSPGAPVPRRLFSLLLLLLAGARLVAADDAAEATASDRVVELPPLMVAEPSNGPPWHYLEAPNLEILSRCSDEAAVHFAQEMNRLQQLLTVLLPENLQAHRTVPDILVMYNERTKPAVAQEVVASALNDSKDGKAVAKSSAVEPFGGQNISRRMSFPTAADNGDVTYGSIPNLRLTDRDSVAGFFIIDEQSFIGSPLVLTPEYIRFAVRSRTPALPTWFVEGFVELYDHGDFERNPVTLGPVQWGSETDTKNLKSDPDYPRTLIPLARFFTQPPPATPAETALWRSQAALFLRWAMDGENHPRREALWRFVARLGTSSGATEELFRDCFGLGYVDAQERLSDYLPSAVIGSVHFDAGASVPLPKLAPRVANEAEIARVKGDLERLEAGWIKARYPQLTQKYLEQARRTFARAYDQGLRDSRLLAVMGLCEVDAGNDAGAQKYLESALRGGGSALRPRASFELARLRYGEAKKAPAAPGERLSAEQASAVLQPLAASHAATPPLLETYALIADVWAHSVPAFTHQNLAILDEGVANFPRNQPLIYQAAWLNARQGFTAEADALIARGLNAGPDPASRARLEQLRSKLSLVNNGNTTTVPAAAQP